MSSKEYGFYLTPLVEKSHIQPEYSYSIKANSYGFRGKEPNFKAKIRVLILGDSNGMGQGVGEGENLCELSQSYFDKQGLDLDIFNTSLSGYAAINELKILERWINDYNPNLVILLFSWNDLAEVDSLIVQNGYLVLRRKKKLISMFKEWANNHSHLYCLIKRHYHNIKSINKSIRLRDSESYNLDDYNVVDYILKMKQICDTHNTAFIVVLTLSNASYQPIKSTLLDQLKDNSIFFQDWDLLLPAEKREGLVYKIDRHWTEKGHAYFSRYLNELIVGMINGQSIDLTKDMR